MKFNVSSLQSHDFGYILVKSLLPHYYVLILCVSLGILRFGHIDCFPELVCPKTNEISLVLDIGN